MQQTTVTPRFRSPARRAALLLAAAGLLGSLAAAQDVFELSGSIVEWTAPSTAYYRITAIGAKGGDYPERPSRPAMTGGWGARVGGELPLVAGTTLRIAVGGEGGDSPVANDGGSGGGGSFVVAAGDVPLVIAGGGGGAGFAQGGSAGQCDGRDASVGTSGVEGGFGGAGGTDGGAGENEPVGFRGTPGAGFYESDGCDLDDIGYGCNGAQRWPILRGALPSGGYGGGGASSFGGSGGGGGYSGGGAGGSSGWSGFGGPAGGGGSFLASSLSNTFAEIVVGGDGLVTIEFLAAAPDTDGDGLFDFQEAAHGTDPFDADSDDDGLEDGAEVELADGGACPGALVPDSDGDGLSDGAEVQVGSMPCSADSDGDGLGDALDPTPTSAGAPASYVEARLRDRARRVLALAPPQFESPTQNGAMTKKNVTSGRFLAAANAVAAGNYPAAIAELEELRLRVDGQPSPADWMKRGPFQVAVHGEVQLLIALIGLL